MAENAFYISCSFHDITTQDSEKFSFSTYHLHFCWDQTYGLSDANFTPICHLNTTSNTSMVS